MAEIFRNYQCSVGGSWQWIRLISKLKHLCRATDKESKTIGFLLTAKRDKATDKYFWIKPCG
jgi:transposase-like protein